MQKGFKKSIVKIVEGYTPESEISTGISASGNSFGRWMPVSAAIHCGAWSANPSSRARRETVRYLTSLDADQ